ERLNLDNHVGPLGQLLSLNKEQFGPNDVIIISAGKIAFLTARDGNLPAGAGISDFFAPVADVYIVPVGRTVDTGVDPTQVGDAQITGGDPLIAAPAGPNTTPADGLGGTFGEEIIGVTAQAGNLGQGEYSVVYDEDQNGIVDKYDAVFEDAFSVDLLQGGPPP